jgi:BMFP domain-containing protein YqiC
VNGVIVALSAALGGIITATVAALAARGRTKSEAQHIEAQAVDVISRAAADFVERSAAQAIKNEARLEQKIVELEGSVSSARKELSELRAVVVALSAQLTAAGITPVTQADPWRT